MEPKKTMLPSLLILVLLAFTLAAPALAQADRGHHGHQRHGHHHHKHHNHFNGYNFIYSQPRGYNRPYYPQPRYNYNYNYYPAPVYGPLPNMMMGIDTGNTSFMLRF